jgi:transcriptional regulator with XRE-family HTH domain
VTVSLSPFDSVSISPGSVNTIHPGEFMKNTKELLGARIRELRKARGLTQEQLAEMVDIEQKHVSRIELGKNYPTIDRLEKIAEALNLPMQSFFDFLHLEDDDEQAASIEKMLGELDTNSRRIAYRMIKGFIRLLQDM